ncbi:MAG TPA: hypothetical protein ENN80_15345 [Candidatus Hydrogenedentes bacterium]|nr:hypothetical protein [Candidatus Hydrogenedentota bacterium]
MKRAFIAVGLILVLAAMGAVVLFLRLEEMTKAGLELQLSYMFMADVTIGAAKISHVGHTLELSDVEIGNPPAFRKGPAMHFNTILVSYAPWSFFTRTPTLHRILVQDGDVHLRYELGEGTNLSALADNVINLETPAADSGRDQAPKPEWGLDAMPRGLRRKLKVAEFSCERTKIHLSTNMIPLSSVSMNLAPFRLKELTEGKPVSVPRVAFLFVRSLMIETLSLKGLLRPVAKMLRSDVESMSF